MHSCCISARNVLASLSNVLRYVEKEKKKKGLFVFLFLRIWTRLYRKSLSDTFSGFTKPGWKRLLSKDIDESVNNGKLRKGGI